MTAYKSPISGDAIALLVNAGATMMARVDLTLMLGLAQTVTPHVCDVGTLPSTVVTSIGPF